MRILSIGNSFSDDAQRWLHDLSVAAGNPIECVNAYIGGCTLNEHSLNYRERLPKYMLQVNGEVIREEVTLNDILADGRYDVVTLQQASHASGLVPSYTPYIHDLADMVAAAQPQAKLMVHQTWAYDEDSTHDMFVAYNNNQTMMHEQLHRAYDIAAMALDAQLIPSGDLIQELRNSPYFAKRGAEDPDQPLPSLTRDGFHLNLYYARYAVSALWYAVLMQQPVSGLDWTPPEPEDLPENQKLKPEVWDFIRSTVDRLAKENIHYEAELIGDVPDVTTIPGSRLS